jgi:BirA family biotin operon repressor/biotin-[acetyl-CoA-carboxylase] ligase
MLVISYDSVDTTQEKARELLEEGIGDGEAVLVSAREQTAGKARHGRVWRSPRGGIYFTLAHPLHTEAQAAAASLPLGLALCEALEAEYDLPARTLQIKWPNDVHARGRKLAGILCEVVTCRGVPHLLAGIGVNVLVTPELAVPAASPPGYAAEPIRVADLIDRPCGDLTLLTATLGEAALGALDRHLRQGLTEATRRAIEIRLRGRGNRIDVALPDGETVSGELVGLSAAGSLQIRTQAGEISLGGGAEVRQIHDNWLPRISAGPGENPPRTEERP